MRRNKSPSHAGSGHTDTATINTRRPMTVEMVALLGAIEAAPAYWCLVSACSRAEKNQIRALVDRGYLEYAGNTYTYANITPTGREALKQ